MVSFSAVFIKLYPDKVSTITSWNQTAFGVGYCFGPALGGFLYDLGGFHLPFIYIGVSNIIFAILTLFALSSEDCSLSGETKPGNSYISMILIKVQGNQFKLTSQNGNMSCCRTLPLLFPMWIVLSAVWGFQWLSPRMPIIWKLFMQSHLLQGLPSS